ncbi:hypothetical protein Aglo01_66080 [Actinokineospora globicatena]|nr:hypothetical protein Aglo01_66080 [Actinokineospora globicatena]GLW88920.1 hypothetical protein Aglo02_65590 [Actinokineospora globicatena]
MLGPLAVADGPRLVTPSAPKQRQVLALLLVNANHVVPVRDVVTELWEYDPPRSAVAAVHNNVMLLRRALRDDRIATTDQGYLLRTRAGELDLAEFADAVTSARAWLSEGRHADAGRRLRSALAVWGGPALVDVAVGPLLQAAVDRAERLRLEAVTARISVELVLGLHREVLGELAGLVHDHPADEGLIRLLMLALYRAGRQADAIALYTALRGRLSAEPALAADHPEPEARTAELYTDILIGDPLLDVPALARVGP